MSDQQIAFSILALPFGLAFVLGYLLGSIPFGLLLTRAAGLGDIRAIGSGNIGATNVLRTGNKKLAAATLLLDALKGSAAVWLAVLLLPDVRFYGFTLPVMAGFGAFIGHLYPVWLKFNGGKGVATFIGITLALWWPGVVVFAVGWLGTAKLTRYSSLAALVASVLTPLAAIALAAPLHVRGEIGVLLVLLSTLLILKHRPNIARLIAGTESRIGDKAAKGETA